VNDLLQTGSLCHEYLDKSNSLSITNKLKGQESNRNLITSGNWGIVNFFILAVLIFNQYLLWKTNTAKHNPPNYRL